MNVSLLIKIVGRWFFCIPLFLAGALTTIVPFIVSPALPAYFFHKGWIIAFSGLSVVNFSLKARQQYSRYKAFQAAWKDAAAEPPRKEKATNRQQQNRWVNWPVLIVMGGCMAVTYYLLTATQALIENNDSVTGFVNAARQHNEYLIAWSIWPLIFAFEVYLLYRVFTRRLARWTVTQSQFLLIPVASATGGFFSAWVTTAPGAAEYPFLLLACVAAGAVALALYFPTQKKRAEKLRVDNATIDGRRVPDPLVSISLAVPSNTPSPALILAELPDYCIPLLRLQSSLAYPGTNSYGGKRAGVNANAQTLFEKFESIETTIQMTMEWLRNNQRFKIALGVAAAVIGITIAVGYKRAELSLPDEHRQAVIQMEPVQSKPHALEASLSTSTPPMPVSRAQITSHASEDNTPRELTPAQTTQRESNTENEVEAEDPTDNLYLYGLMYEEGGALPQSDSQAVMWYKLATAKGNAKGEAALANMYLEGRGGLPQSDIEAVKWATKAASQNNAAGQALLGFMYEKGRGGLPQSDSEAVAWYRQAANQGNAKGQTLLGSMYILGKGGLAQDIDTGVELCIKAARQGEPSAQEFLRRINVSWVEPAQAPE